MLLKNKICIVTGAGKGFGRDIAKVFYSEGAKLALITRSQSDVDELNSEFDDKRVLCVCGDVSVSKTVEQFISQTIDKFGSIDVLVNNAGMRFRKNFLDINEEELDTILDVNLKSIFSFCQQTLPHMIKNKNGIIINMSSIAGTLGFANLSGYVMTKSAIIGLTKSLAAEFSDKNIRVNAIAPGFCKTSYFDNFKQNQELYEFTLSRTPMKRWGDSEEIAKACLFLASDMSSYINGEVIKADGGWSSC
jgi:meso-butanediol dehydrogenase / (S,S)-butanediol dehydrogenase / diacetyl reductase